MEHELDWHSLVHDAMDMFVLLKKVSKGLESIKDNKSIKSLRAELDAMIDILDEKYGIKESDE